MPLLLLPLLYTLPGDPQELRIEVHAELAGR
jgi:hypothetical protein